MTTTATRHHASRPSSADSGGGSRLYIAQIAGIAAAFVALELAVAARYGFHRDELYFLACARHLAWGYVDQPPLVPAVARMVVAVFGSSVVALRFFPAIAGGMCIVLTACMARELGGGRRAQLLSALAAATSAQVLAAEHLLSTAAFDLFFWSAITYLVLRLLHTGNERWWLAIGTVTGIGLLNKYNVAFLLLGLAVGLAGSGRARMLTSRWLWTGAAIALAIWTPNLVWNAHHDWAAVAMLHSLHQENSTLGASIGFIPAQILIVGPVLLLFWVAGLRRLLRHPFGRPLGLAYLTLLVLDVITGAKPYYLGGIYFVLFAAGGLRLEERLATSDRSPRWYAWLFVIGAIVALPLTLPVLPVRALARGPWEGSINKDLSATVGWEPFVHQLAGVVASLPPSQRAHVVIFTGDYGAAGAVDLYGRRYGLPHAMSGHNSYWWWGPADATNDATTIAVDLPRDYLETIFAKVVPAGSVNAPNGIWTEERGDAIWICSRQKTTWTDAWPNAKHYG
jgi:4-amino-4-deoxy-L-arabinose transferase-like glycosyltransferase